MLSAGWTLVCPAGGGVPLRSSTSYDNPYPWTSLKLRSIVAASGANESKHSGDFAGLSALKEQLSREGKSSRERGFDGLSVLKEQVSEKRSQKAPPGDDNNNPGGKGSVVTLLVSNLAKEVTKAEYESLMQRIPQASHWTFLTHRSGRCRGYGFCEIRPGADVAAAIDILNEQTLGGRLVKASIATGKKQSDPDAAQQEFDKQQQNAADSSIQGKAESADVKRKPPVRNLKSTLKLRSEGGVQQQQQSSNRHAGEKYVNGRNSLNSSGQQQDRVGRVRSVKPRNEAAAVEPPKSQNTTSSDPPDRLSGQKVLDALQRFASAGRASSRQRKAKGSPARSSWSSSELEDDDDDDDTEKSDELQLVELRPDWIERIQSLEASIEHLKRS